MLEIEKKETCQISQDLELPNILSEIVLKRKFNNESLMFIQFLYRKLKIQAVFVFKHLNRGVVLVTKKPVRASRIWTEFVNLHPAYSEYDVKFYKVQETWDLKTIFNVLLPQVAVQSFSIEENRISVHIPKNQMKYAIGKGRKNELFMNEFLSQCTELPYFEYKPI